VLLGATAAAFVVTERLKLEPSPITHVFVTKIFSPTCDCETDLGVIAFRLRRANRLTLEIADGSGHAVRTLVGPIERRRGEFSASWDGRDQDGAVVPDGVYRPLVHLRHRTILMPNRISIDTTPPRVHVHKVRPRVLQSGEPLSVSYTLNEPAHVDVFLNGRRVIAGHSTRTDWKVEAPVRAAPGKYSLTVAARDIAGNLSNATKPVLVIVPMRVVTQSVQVKPKRRFTVELVTDGRAYHWQLAGNEGFASAQNLVLRAPKKAGRYALVIRQDGIPHRALVVVK